MSVRAAFDSSSTFVVELPIHMATPTVNVGVLALQGSFREHMKLLQGLPGVLVSEIRTAEELRSAFLLRTDRAMRLQRVEQHKRLMMQHRVEAKHAKLAAIKDRETSQKPAVRDKCLARAQRPARDFQGPSRPADLPGAHGPERLGPFPGVG